ncbi:hypothetical protein IHE45_07G115700 [Dioscorea alata]|uniref:Uncharacterized protein n=1 Tax=Dioscorea alata TaxID=55571 RepID=A0ACB7VU41_DIOAL|nr:hypothetical protein IHE45_07G115700 [Dioscorea alata]
MANANPTPNPSPLNIQIQISSMSSSGDALLRFVEGSMLVELTHCLDNGKPQSPGFPSNEALGNVLNWFPCGILPTKLLFDRFRKDKNVREVREFGISPES